MSDANQGPGWWQAADGKWYPPEQHPDFGPDATQAIPESGPPPTAAMPPVPPRPSAPLGPPPGAPLGPPPGAPGAGSNNAKWIVVGAVAAAIVLLTAFLLLRDDDKNTNVAASSSSSTTETSSESESASESSSSSTKSSSSSTSSSSAEGIGDLSKSEIDSRLVRAADLGGNFTDVNDQSNPNAPNNCGGPSLNSQVPPEIDSESNATTGAVFFAQTVLVYDSEADANEALDAFVDGVNCPEPTTPGGGPAAFDGPDDPSSQIDTDVDDAVHFDFQSEEAQGQAFVVRIGNALVGFQFVAQKGTDLTGIPAEIDVVNFGLEKLLG